jgi:hypothetical protein
MNNAKLEKKEGAAPCLKKFLQTDQESAPSNITDSAPVTSHIQVMGMTHVPRGKPWAAELMPDIGRKLDLVNTCLHVMKCDIFRSAFIGSVLEFTDFLYKILRARGQVERQRHCEDGLCLTADFHITGIKYTDSTRRVLVNYS